jgi:hypothetical protein
MRVAGGYFFVRGRNPALRSASSAEGDEPVPVFVVGVVVGVVVAVLGTPVDGVVDGLIVVGVPGVTAPPAPGAATPPRPVAPAVPVAPLVVVGIVLCVAPGTNCVAVVIVRVIAGGVVAVGEPPLSFTSAAASTPSASTHTAAIAKIGPFQFVGAARRVRAAAPQFRHHSCRGSSGAPHRGQAASTGGLVGLTPGVEAGGG